LIAPHQGPSPTGSNLMTMITHVKTHAGI
jgi:hypothetical protein